MCLRCLRLAVPWQPERSLFADILPMLSKSKQTTAGQIDLLLALQAEGPDYR